MSMPPIATQRTAECPTTADLAPPCKHSQMPCSKEIRVTSITATCMVVTGTIMTRLAMSRLGNQLSTMPSPTRAGPVDRIYLKSFETQKSLDRRPTWSCHGTRTYRRAGALHSPTVHVNSHAALEAEREFLVNVGVSPRRTFHRQKPT